MTKNKGILLRKTRYAEADLILHVLTADGLKLNFIARSALKSKKRFGGGVLEPTHYISLSYRQRHEIADLHTLNEASIVNDFSELKTDYDRLQLGLSLVGLVDKVCKEGEVGLENLFHLLGNSLKAAETTENIYKLKALFEFKLLAYLGIRPDWNEIQLFSGKDIRTHEEVELSETEACALSNRALRFLEEHFQLPDLNGYKND